MPLRPQPPPKGCNCFLWFSSFLQTRWRGLSHFLAANQRDLVIVWGSGKCVLAELVAKKKKKTPHNYIQPLPELSHFACVIRERSSLVTRLPEDKLPLELRGMKREWDECFVKLLSPKIFFQLIILYFAIFPLMPERVQPGTNYHSECYIYMRFSCLVFSFMLWQFWGFGWRWL